MTMNREELQRREELEYAARFFNHHFGLVPQFENLPTNSRPDVCVSFEGKRIGIELTRAVDEEQAVFDSFAGYLLDAARARYAELGGLPGMVMVSLRPKFPVRGLRGQALGVELAQNVAALWREPTGTTIIPGARLSPAVRRVVSQVRAFPAQGSRTTAWQSPIAAWVQGITVDRLQPIINRKSEELNVYRQMKCDEYWLLIYARPGKSAEIFDEAHGFDSAALTSQFDRTFFYDFWRSKALAQA
jgi:hypothetical protein